ncbi:MAG: 1-deoxy-D-xylulose-5-phosphate synthase, partial [Ignavibacteria bacterium]|nr:1-deoxy-D-xylulose-5-phosphate synthase [Ignavibacteria bacterium]
MIPDMVIMAPKDEAELRNMLYTAVEHCKGPVALRYPRGSALGVQLKEGFEKIEIGKSETLSKGKDIAMLAVGSMVTYAWQAEEILKKNNINCELINMRFVKPLDKDLIDDIAARHSKIVTLEENNLPGGFGSAIIEYLSAKNYKNDVLRIGLPDKFVDHGTQAELHKALGIDPEGITEQVKEFYSSKKITQEVEL